MVSYQHFQVVKRYPLKDYALLTNDAFHVTTMKKYGITNIARNDPDFERVEWIKIWKP
ncbi:MAG: PIN domain protein [Candidatus Methanolliviera sp. GoM_oil]|jgi:predicted nucleic acid-binding protein|nr:MAG: PIN domain protein [Candidatus Methanolliviera sp. GoM_oil]